MVLHRRGEETNVCLSVELIKKGKLATVKGFKCQDISSIMPFVRMINLPLIINSVDKPNI